MEEIAAPHTLAVGWLFQHTTVSCFTCAHTKESRVGKKYRWCPILEGNQTEDDYCRSWKVAVTEVKEEKNDHESAD